jgi:hypothetical protein
VVVIVVGICYEWNWANENAKHYHPNYCMHTIFQTVMNGLNDVSFYVAYFKNNFVTFIITISPGLNCDIHCVGILNLWVKTPNASEQVAACISV